MGFVPTGMLGVRFGMMVRTASGISTRCFRLGWHLTDVHADRYFGRYRGKNGHSASTREPTRLTQSGHRASAIEYFRAAHLTRYDALPDA